MKITEKIRHYSFWLIDFLKGSKIRKHYNDIRSILNNYNTVESIKKKESYLTKIINHAITSTEFYSSYSKNNISISDFPVINKNVIRENSSKFHARTNRKGKKYLVTTTGSTGTPLEITYDENKKSRNTADVIYFSELANFRVGYKLLYLRKWSVDLEKSFSLKKIQNIMPLEVLNLEGTYISNFIDKIKKDSSTKGWIGYASAFEVICKYLEKSNHEPINANLKSIIAVSEGLNEYTKKTMSHYFNAPVFSRYSNMENGILAQQTMDSRNDFFINWASYYIEILDLSEDKPAKSGEMGRIVITDLFNYYMPIIRYDTGDIGLIDFKANPPAFKKVEGRKTDIIYNTKGIIVPSIIIASIDRYEGIIQGQLIQEEEKEYTLKLNVTEAFNRKEEITTEFKKYLGSDAIIIIQFVNEIPLLDSGKRRSTVNNYR